MCICVQANCCISVCALKPWVVKMVTLFFLLPYTRYDFILFYFMWNRWSESRTNFPTGTLEYILSDLIIIRPAWLLAAL